MQQFSYHLLAPLLDKAVFEFTNTSKAPLEYLKDMEIRTNKNEHTGRGVNIGADKPKVGQKPSMGVKKRDRRVLTLPKTPNFWKGRRGSSPVIVRHRKDSNGLGTVRRGLINIRQYNNKRSNSNISNVGVGIRQGLINIGKFLQAAQYIITLTVVFSIAWFPFLIVVLADTITRNFNEGFHKVEG